MDDISDLRKRGGALFYVERLDVAGGRDALSALAALLSDAVTAGAALGFVPPLDMAEADAYWQDALVAVEKGVRVLLVARAVEDGRIVGTASLELAQKANGRHRAEVTKVIVDARARQRGIGRLLLDAVEDEARRLGRTLLVLDTRRGDIAEGMYRTHGYEVAGIIPRYASEASGALHDTVVFYREIDATSHVD